MTIRLFFLFFTIGLGSAVSAPRPNILYFYVDDMGWGSIGPNAQAERRAKGLPNVKTPNLDQLAAEGINFTRAYGATVCSPARSSQQTGYHQGHTFADRNDPNNAKKAMRADDVCMADALSKAGYNTGYWGKWGYGGSKDMADPTLDNLQTLPTSHGYQHVLAELHHVRAHTFFQPTLWSAPAKPGAKGGLELVPNTMKPFAGDDRYPAQPSNHNHPDYPKTGYCDDGYAFAALDFVRAGAMQYHTDGKPFFGLLAVQIPHAPFDEIEKLPEWDAAYADDPHFAKLADQTKQWAAMVTRIDAHFGNILAALDDPNGDGDISDSVAGNTLVIFMSDNGGPGGKNNVELDANGGLRGTKGSIYEGGIRVPTIMRWPAGITKPSKLKAGTDSDIVIDVSDLLPTFCELAGVDAPVGLDGVSIAPTLTGEGEQRKREFLIHEAGKGSSIIRGKDKLVRTKGGLELYDLETDHAEENNIAKANKKRVRELEKLLLGERVAEPRGFANTYHHWTGDNGADAAKAENWSDYVYENAGEVYLTDDGAPRLSWTAVMENRVKKNSVATTSADLEFLGLEVRGKAGATQELILESGAGLNGRNELRIGEGGILTLKGGEVSSLRWVDVKEGGQVRGSGKIDATLYHAGEVTLAAAQGATGFEVVGNYRQSEAATLGVILTNSPIAYLRIEGDAHLAGELRLSLPRDFSPKPGEVFSLATTKSITGRFSNRHDEVTSGDGTRFSIRYSDTTVTLKVIDPPDRSS